MIPRLYIDGWRQKAPWRSNAMVEQDLIISRTVVEIFRQPLLSTHLVFRGGTALHKLFFHPPRRYSEDIDLVQILPGPIGPIFDALRENLAPYLGKPKRTQGAGVVTLIYRMTSEVPPVSQMKLKVEINSREHFAAIDIRRQSFAVDSPWFKSECDIPVFCLEELLATKLRALYQRRKGRDLFDLWLGLTEGKADPDKIVSTFRRYMEQSGHPVSRAEFEANLGKKRHHPAFTADINDLLPSGTHYDFADGFAVVEREIIPLL